jgi:cytochrome c biogenesis protein CcmG/thiol:disulfide interchange protein DsbE
VKRRTIAISATIALLVVVALSGFLATRHAAPEASEFHSPLLGHPAPTFAATTLDGQRISLSALHGGDVVLTFWSSWCNPCIQEAPELSTFSWQERTSKVRVLGVVFNDDVAAARQFESHYGSLYPSLIDPNGAIANAYGVTAPPTTFVINAKGIVAATLVGATSAKQLAQVVSEVG